MPSDALDDTPNHEAEGAHELDTLQPPAGFRDSVGDRSSYATGQSFGSSTPLPGLNLPYQEPPTPVGPQESAVLLAAKEERTAAASPPIVDHEDPAAREDGRKKRPWILIAGAGLLILAIIIIAVIVPVYFKVIKPHNSSASSSDTAGKGGGGSSSGGGGSSTSSGAAPIPTGAITGGQGSLITTDDGTTFTYMNPFGGIWVSDPNDPYSYNAQAQSWSKPLNQSWDWTVDKVKGVNLGGWLVPEPFIVPALFEQYMNDSSIDVKDEWSLSQAMANDTANGGLNQLETHYKTFIVSVSWTYILKAFQWARKYGLRINLDLHTMPGSQNGYNHSGKGGQVDWLNGVMGLANAQRGLDYMRVFVEFITQPEFANLVPHFGVVNEPLVTTIGMDTISSFYLHMHDVLRNITGIGAGHGPYLSFHDGFQPLSTWAGFLPGNDRMALDSHPYMCFVDQDPSPISSQHTKPCDYWADNFNTSWTKFGVTTAGEWSLAINDCGYWVNGVGAGSRWAGTLSGFSGTTGGDGASGCDTWNDWQTWDDTRKADLQAIALASMDALQNWFFWTWRIGNSSVTGTVGAPLWSYSLGLEQGYMPADPRAAVGVCGGGSPAGALTPLQTGGAGAGDFSASVRNANPWPPTNIGGNAASDLPTYTQTGLPIPTLAMPSVSATVTDKGWFDAADTTPMFTPVAGCTYPDAWNAVDASVPPACSGTAQRRVRNVIPMPKRTALPA
ncbi:hypothetical protein FRB98_006024 [Tulasnella sp. 332]|nr:hypothetical protein FRB98_006024 [Tulasnella sp. 332]